MKQCPKLLFKSTLSKYLHAEADGIYLNSNGSHSNVRSAFLIQQLGEHSATLQSLKSGKVLFDNVGGFELTDASNDAFQNTTIFTIVPEMEGTVLLQSHDKQFVDADENGLIVKSDNQTENRTWILECIRGLKHFQFSLFDKYNDLNSWFTGTIPNYAIIKFSVFVI